MSSIDRWIQANRERDSPMQEVVEWFYNWTPNDIEDWHEQFLGT